MSFDPKIQAIHDQRLLRIGSVCAQWSDLEYTLFNALGKLIDVDYKTCQILFGGLDMRPRIAMAIELAQHLEAPDALVDELVAVRLKIDGGLLKRRNRVIHGTQFIYEDGELQIEVHRGKDRARRPLTLKELMALENDLFEVGSKLADVVNETLWGVTRPPYTLLKKPAKRSRKKKAPKQDQIPKPPEPPPQSSEA